MPTMIDEDLQHNLLFLTTPALWPNWPTLPMVRRRNGEVELGFVFDAMHVGVTGYSCTVFLGNALLLPEKLDELLALPRGMFDTPEEVYEAGWRVD